jgi:glycosyltransferase involved in cell wall biosynthesis
MIGRPAPRLVRHRAVGRGRVTRVVTGRSDTAGSPRSATARPSGSQPSVHVLHLLPDLATGGGQRVVLETLRRLDSDRFRITVGHVGSDDTMAGDFRAAGLDVLPFPPRTGLARAATALDVARFVRAEHVDVIHCHGGPEARIAEGASLLTRAPLVRHVHNTSMHRPEGRPAETRAWSPGLAWRRLRSRLVRRHFVAVSEPAYREREPWVRSNGEAISLVPNGVDVARFDVDLAADREQELRRELDIQDRGPLLLNVAMLLARKGQRVLVPVMREVVARHPGAVMVIVGEGPERADLERTVADAGLERAFRLPGTRHDVPQLMALCDAFVFPTRNEGMPIALLEAMAAEMPVVVSDLPVLAAVVDQGRTGLLVDPEDSAAFADAVLSLLGDPARSAAMGEAAGRAAREQFDIGRTAAGIERLYLALVGDRPG